MDSLLIAKTLALLVLPPGGIFLLLLAGLILAQVRRRAGQALMILALLGGAALSMPLVSNALIVGLERYPPLDLSDASLRDAAAIVLLGGGRREYAPEYLGETVSARSLERVRYAAKLGRELGLPILVSGGSVRGQAVAEASLMADALVELVNRRAGWKRAVETRTRTRSTRLSFCAPNAQAAARRPHGFGSYWSPTRFTCVGPSNALNLLVSMRFQRQPRTSPLASRRAGACCSFPRPAR